MIFYKNILLLYQSLLLKDKTKNTNEHLILKDSFKDIQEVIDITDEVSDKIALFRINYVNSDHLFMN